MSYKLNELKQMVQQTKKQQAWENFLTRIRESYLLESPLFIKEASIRKNRYPFKAIFVLGPAGAGKSFLSGQIGIPKDFKISNPDERIEQVFPAFGVSMKFVGKQDAENDPSGAKAKEMNIQQTSRNIMSNATAGHTANLTMIANPLIFDTTGEDPDKMIPRMKNLVRLGYDVGIFMVNVPTDVSVDRDKKRERTVGEPTKDISIDYQKNVVQDKAYLNLAAEMENSGGLIRTFGGEIYPNLFNLDTGELLKGITQDHVDAIAPGLTPEKAQAILTKARSDLKAWLTPEPINPTGKKLLKAMKALVSITGRYGQSMNDLSFSAKIAKEYPEILSSEEIMQGIDTIEKLAGESGTIKNAIQGMDKDGKQMKDAPMQTQKGQKNVKGQTVRGLSGSERGSRRKQDNLDWEKERAAEIEKVKQGLGKYKGLSPEEKEKKIQQLHQKKKDEKEKYEERLSKETIYNIVRSAIN